MPMPQGQRHSDETRKKISLACRRYPWEEWFASGIRVLKAGEDYTCAQSTMVQNIRNNASVRGLLVRIKDHHTEIVVEVVGVKQSADALPV